MKHRRSVLVRSPLGNAAAIAGWIGEDESVGYLPIWGDREPYHSSLTSSYQLLRGAVCSILCSDLPRRARWVLLKHVVTFGWVKP